MPSESDIPDIESDGSCTDDMVRGTAPASLLPTRPEGDRALSTRDLSSISRAVASSDSSSWALCCSFSHLEPTFKGAASEVCVKS